MGDYFLLTNLFQKRNIDLRDLFERGIFMSKKVLTPEQAEIKAIKKSNSSNRWTTFWAMILAIALTFGIVSMGKSTGAEKAADTSTNVTESSDNSVNNNQPSTQNTQQNSSTDEQTTISQPDNVNADEISDDPSKWSKEQIVYMYKQAATKSHDKVESSQTMEMPKLVVNDGDGAMNWFVQMLVPVINSVITKQATTYGGITGGYANLVASDVDTAKAYKDGKYTVIEMRMVEQTDGIYGDAQGGTVGHAINVLGNVATAVEQFPDFDIKYEEADIKVHYADPIVKVRINEDGIIEKGTWSYTSEIYIAHLQINSIMINKADAEIKYVIVVGGGF